MRVSASAVRRPVRRPALVIAAASPAVPCRDSPGAPAGPPATEVRQDGALLPRG